MLTHHLIEPLESRIAPAAIVNPLFDITASTGQRGTNIDLGTLVDPAAGFRTIVELVTNFTPLGEDSPAIIRLELFDDKAPLTVANFLRYLNNRDTAADYDGTFFHRLAGQFVLQGGGFNAETGTSQHITTFPGIHNEFDPNDPERSNLAQTVAVAKVAADQGGGPHSGTSEFFINLGNNSENLDAQNGGFSVFGRITDDSMPFVNQIAALQIVGGGPVQNYTSGTPTPDQLIQIVDARVATPTPSNADGYSFSVAVTDSTTGAATNLVKAKVNNATGKLDLSFSKTLNGTARVAVTATKDGVSETDEFLVNINPNLIANITRDGLPSTFVSGDQGTARVNLTNTAGGLAKGRVNVKLYLSESNFNAGSQTDALGFDFDDTTDLLIGTANNVSIQIASGRSGTIPVKFTIPSEGLTDGSRYRVLAVIETPDGSRVQELFSDDNVGNFILPGTGLGSDQVLHTFDVAFGQVGGRNNVPVTVNDANGDPLTFILRGPGTGTITFENGIPNTLLTGTSAATTLLVKTARGTVADIGDLFINQTIGTVSLANTHLHGDFTASGGLRTAIFGDLGNTDPTHPENNADRTLSISAFPNPSQNTVLRFASVNDYTLASDARIASLTATEWLNDATNTNPNSISAPGISQIRITGDLEASVTILDEFSLNRFSIGGAFNDATLRTAGNIGTLLIGDLSGASIFAGVLSKPDSIADLSIGTAISSLRITGTFSDSIIAAETIRTAFIAAVDGNAGDSIGGIYADAIKNYVRKGFVSFRSLDIPIQADSVPPNYEVVLL